MDAWAAPFANRQAGGFDQKRRIPARSAIVIFVVLLASVGLSSAAQNLLPRANAIRSSSGQFVVQSGRRVSSSPSVLDSATNAAFLRLDPSLLIVSCERIKTAFLREIEATGPWRSKVFLQIRPATTSNDPALIACEQFRDGWNYTVDLPEVVERNRYVAAITQVLLLERANVGAQARPAEIPLWLSEGMARQILSSRELQLLLSPPELSANGLAISPTFVSARREDPLEKAHALLSQSPPLTFHQLSWPSDEQLRADKVELFRCNTHLLVNRLLTLDEGPACMRQMLSKLPAFLNWQFALLEAYRPHFQRPLDVEKWWALQQAMFTGRELSQGWPLDESWQKLDQAIHSPVQLRSLTNDLPIRGETTLQAILREWPADAQKQLIETKLSEFQALRLRLAPDLVPLIDGYSQALGAFLQNRNDARLIARFRKQAGQRKALESCLKELNALDAKLQELRPPKAPRIGIEG